MKFYSRWHFNWKFKIELMKSILIFNPYSMICCRKNKPVNIFVWGSKSHIEPGGVWQFLSGILFLILPSNNLCYRYSETRTTPGLGSFVFRFFYLTIKIRRWFKAFLSIAIKLLLKFILTRPQLLNKISNTGKIWNTAYVWKESELSQCRRCRGLIKGTLKFQRMGCREQIEKDELKNFTIRASVGCNKNVLMIDITTLVNCKKENCFRHTIELTEMILSVC